MPSASEMQRSLSERYEEQCDRANNLRLSKFSREMALREARELAEELGIEGPPPVNGDASRAAWAAREETGHLPRDPYQNLSKRHIKQTPTAVFLPVEGREYLLTKGQRYVIIAALDKAQRRLGSSALSDLSEERRMLIELLAD